MPPAASLREILIAEVAKRLGAILGGANYNFEVAEVQRYTHKWGISERELNDTPVTPAIVVYEIAEDGTADDAGENAGAILRTLTLELEWRFQGDSASSDQLNKALQDMERALFRDADTDQVETTFGAGVRTISTSTRQFDPQTGQPADGILLQVTLGYTTDLGSPDVMG